MFRLGNRYFRIVIDIIRQSLNLPMFSNHVSAARLAMRSERNPRSMDGGKFYAGRIY
jgi:hypothetical protein